MAMTDPFDVGATGIIEPEILTFNHSTLSRGTQTDPGDQGKPVKITGNMTVSLCSDGDIFHGVALTIETGIVGVALLGVFTMPYTGADPTVGIVKLVANDAGGVKVDATNGRDVLVLSVDIAAKTVQFILRNV